MPSVKNNVIFNYIGQIYVAFIGIACLPLYLKYLGAEAYGLVGFFTLLQAWMQLLDLGMSPTLGREVARLHPLAETAHQLRSVVRSVELIFICIAVVITVPLFLGRYWVAEKWLSIHELDVHLVSTCIGLMALMLGIRWLAALHRSGINAYEQQVWMNVTNVVFVTLRFPGSLLLIIYYDSSILLFFSYQLLLAILEQATITRKFYRLLPKAKQAVGWFNLKEARRIAPFALSVAYTGGIWVVVTQLDKLLLSKVLTLADYGYFTLVATISSGVMVLSWPVSTAVLPRMTALLSENREEEMLLLYRKATRFVVCMVTPVTLMLAFFPGEITYIWTGDRAAADWVAPVLPLFILGNGLLAIGAFQYYLQYAHGKLRLHVKFNTISAALSIPSISYAAFQYGPIGVGYVWLGFRLLSLLVWTPYVHKTYAPGLHNTWMLKDVLQPFGISAILLATLIYPLQGHFPADRIYGFFLIAIAVAFVTAITLIFSFNTEIRGYRAKFQSR